jgi:hypothetical protein
MKMDSFKSHTNVFTNKTFLSLVNWELRRYMKVRDKYILFIKHYGKKKIVKLNFLIEIIV